MCTRSISDLEKRYHEALDKPITITSSGLDWLAVWAAIGVVIRSTHTPPNLQRRLVITHAQVGQALVEEGVLTEYSHGNTCVLPT